MGLLTKHHVRAQVGFNVGTQALAKGFWGNDGMLQVYCVHACMYEANMESWAGQSQLSSRRAPSIQAIPSLGPQVCK